MCLLIHQWSSTLVISSGPMHLTQYDAVDILTTVYHTANNEEYSDLIQKCACKYPNTSSSAVDLSLLQQLLRHNYSMQFINK